MAEVSFVKLSVHNLLACKYDIDLIVSAKGSRVHELLNDQTVSCNQKLDPICSRHDASEFGYSHSTTNAFVEELIGVLGSKTCLELPFGMSLETAVTKRCPNKRRYNGKNHENTSHKSLRRALYAHLGVRRCSLIHWHTAPRGNEPFARPSPYAIA